MIVHQIKTIPLSIHVITMIQDLCTLWTEIYQNFPTPTAAIGKTLLRMSGRGLAARAGSALSPSHIGRLRSPFALCTDDGQSDGQAMRQTD